MKLPRNSQPITGGGRVYIAAGSNGVYALSQASGSVVWNGRPGGNINSTPAYDAETGAVFVVSANGTLYKLNASTGQTTGQFASGGTSTLPLPPAVVGDRVIFSMGDQVYAVSKTSLSQLWSYDAVGRVPHTTGVFAVAKQRHCGEQRPVCPCDQQHEWQSALESKTGHTHRWRPGTHVKHIGRSVVRLARDRRKPWLCVDQAAPGLGIVVHVEPVAERQCRDALQSAVAARIPGALCDGSGQRGRPRLPPMLATAVSATVITCRWARSP